MGEPVDFDAYVVTRRRTLLRIAWLLTGDWHAAEDLVQTALMRCYPRWRRISAGDADAYVRRAIINSHISTRRRRWHGEHPTAALPEPSTAGDPYGDFDDQDLLVAALAELPPRQRAVVVLRFWEDLTESQTAEVLGCAVGTVKSQTSKALVNLRTNGLLLEADHHEVER